MENTDYRRLALPVWIRIWWFASVPLAVALSVRLMWEKTVWTWTRGPQAVGFSLWHIHPGFAIFGGLSSYSLIIWLVPAGCYLFVRRRDIHPVDIAMLALALLVLLAMVTPNNFFA